MSSRVRKALVVVCLVLIVLGEWMMWEAVVRPLRSAAPGAWSKEFPSPFYVFYAPIWLWHDLSITLVIISSIILSYLALNGGEECR
jgi:hypothetical protein